ncbi:MAG: phosphatase PAP2 family protein [bacterium]|nr:phosphatase PAP2 family protein [bacterium]
MRDNSSSVVINWNYVTFSLIFAAAITLMIIYAPNVKEFDYNLLKSIQALLAPIPATYVNFITNFGFANHLLWPKITVTAVLLSHARYFKAFLFLFIMEAAGLTLNFMQNAIGRERPTLGFSGYGFPSGHAMMSMCLLGIVIYLILRYVGNQFWKYFLSVVFGLYILFVALSRLYLGAHYPLDVVAGLFIGFIFVNLYIIICKAMNM